jgi:hypothetical protein
MKLDWLTGLLHSIGLALLLGMRALPSNNDQLLIGAVGAACMLLGSHFAMPWSKVESLLERLIIAEEQQAQAAVAAANPPAEAPPIATTGAAHG